ncbi:hypothetical protein BH10PAT1_BH10PAT1_1490 [soil metagenome]
MSNSERETFLDPMQNLKQWLVDEGSLNDQAVFATETVKVFINHYFEELSYPIGISIKKAKYGGQHVWLHIIWPDLSIDSLEQSLQLNSLSKKFVYDVNIPNLPDPSFHLDFISGSIGNLNLEEQLLKEICNDEKSQYIGLLHNCVN